MDYAELIKSLRICGEWGTEVRIPGEPSECDGCSYYDAEKDECKSWDEPWRKEHLLLDAADAIEELQAAVPRWIPVTERLPTDAGIYIICDHYGNVMSRHFCKSHGKFSGYWHFNGSAKYGNPTHWMPLPTPPKEETE